MLTKITVTEKFKEVGVKNLDNRKRVPIGDALVSIPDSFSRVMVFKSDSGDILIRPVAEIPLSDLRIGCRGS